MSGKRHFPWSLAVLLLGLAVIGTGIWFAWRLERTVIAGSDAVASRVLSAIRDLTNLQPTITVNERVFVERSVEAMELAVVSRETTVDRETETSRLYSRSRLRVRGTFYVKAGFDLSEPFTVDIRGSNVTLSMPPARILGVEGRAFEVERRDGLWNPVRDAEISAEIEALSATATAQALELGILDEADLLFSRQLQEKLGQDITIQTTHPRYEH